MVLTHLRSPHTVVGLRHVFSTCFAAFSVLAFGSVCDAVLIDAGAIPASLGNMATARKVFLNNNCIEGTLPATLGNLSSLRVSWTQARSIAENVILREGTPVSRNTVVVPL